MDWFRERAACMIDYIMLWWRYYIISLSWLLLIIFFTYTAILASAFLTEKSFDAEYFRSQCQVISMIVNMGLTAMVVFDYISVGKQLSNWDVVLLIVSMLFAVGIYGHSGIMYTKSTDLYEFPLCWTGFSFLQHLLLFSILWKLKAKILFVSADGEGRAAQRIKREGSN
jgi:hypothetical protein